MEPVKMEGVKEYVEGYDVCLSKVDWDKCFNTPATYEDRLVVLAYNEGGCNCTQVDVLQLIEWVKKNRPELLK